MKVITTYIADDGKKFDNEWDCAEYERELKSNQFKDTALLFNDKGCQLPLSDEGFEDSAFIVAKTDEAAEYLFDEFGDTYSLPWNRYDKKEAGSWIFENENWKELKDFLSLAKIAIHISEL